MDNSVREITAELSRDEKQLAALQNLKHGMSQLREAASLILQPNELRSQSLKSVVQTILTIGDQIEIERSTIEELGTKQKRLKIRGYTEAEPNELLSEATDFYEVQFQNYQIPALCGLL